MLAPICMRSCPLALTQTGTDVDGGSRLLGDEDDGRAEQGRRGDRENEHSCLGASVHGSVLCLFHVLEGCGPGAAKAAPSYGTTMPGTGGSVSGLPIRRLVCPVSWL